MESLRSQFPLIVYGIRSVGVVLIVGGSFRVARASSLAARRGGPVPGERERYARALTDFNRISGGLTILAGAVLLVVAFVAW